MFRTLIYPSSGACDCVDELPHQSSCSVKTDVLAISVPLRCVWCDVFCRLVVGRCILIDFDRYILCFCDHCVRLCVVFFIGCLVFSAKTSVFTEQDDRCGNSSTQSQAPEDGYINVRNMLIA